MIADVATNVTTHRNPLSLQLRLLQRMVMAVRPASLATLVKRALGVPRVVIATPQGRFWIEPLSHLGVELSHQGQYESAMRNTLEQYLSPGAIFVDLGANEGYLTVIGARLCGKGGLVVAIEPQQRLLPVIAENLRLNGIDWVHVVDVAITDRPGSVTLHLAPDVNTGGSGLYLQYKYRVPTQAVAAQTLAQVLDAAKIDAVDLLKVDIEGFEYEALLGSRSVFEQHRVRALAIEVHPNILTRRGKNVADITTMLVESGYKMADSSDHISTGNQEFVIWLAPS